MERYEIIKEVLNDKTDSEKSKESIDEQKGRLKKQIDQLKSIISEMEWNLGALKFGNIKCTFNSENTANLAIDNIPNVNKQLEFQLYRYSGFYCVKFLQQEYVFNFSPLHKYDHKNTFVVQILNNEDKGTLGKWLMPMAIDLNHLVSEIPIDDLKDIPNFLRTCKHYTDCYFIRHEQYTALMAKISDTANCTVQPNLGYTQINLELMGVCDTNTDCYMNIIIYLLYNNGEVRPYKITVDSINNDNLSKSNKKQLLASLQIFKMFDLHVAFEKMLNKEPYIWSRQSGEDSPLDIGAPSGSDEEGFLEKFSFRGKKSFSLERMKQEKRKRHKKTIGVEKHSNLPSTSNNNEKSVSLQNRNKKFKSLDQQDAVIEISNLKQTQLKYMLSNAKLRSGITTPSNNKNVKKHVDKLCTSTPLSNNVPCSTNFASSNIDISDITNDGSTSNNIEIKKHIDVTTNNRPKVEDQYHNVTPVKFLKSKMKEDENENKKERYKKRKKKKKDVK